MSFGMWNRNVEKKKTLCYIVTHRFTVYIKANDIYKDITEDVETRFDTSN